LIIGLQPAACLLTTQNLSKKYNKEKFGLKDYSLTIENGIPGLLDPNGAGKSTLMKIIATISQPTVFLGSIAICFGMISGGEKLFEILFLPSHIAI